MSAALSQVGPAHANESRVPAGLRPHVRIASSQAGMCAADVDYVSAHATSTPIGDRLEARELSGSRRTRSAY